jgi:hypothetical protein
MKDQLIAILEAMRLSQMALAKHFQPGGPMLRQQLRTSAGCSKIKMSQGR